VSATPKWKDAQVSHTLLFSGNDSAQTPKNGSFGSRSRTEVPHELLSQVTSVIFKVHQYALQKRLIKFRARDYT
jgi:hypothetical protein